MRFFLRKKRQPPAVIIVALIDVLIVVLIFLMVTTSFKKPQAALRLALPESSQAQKMGVTEKPPLILSIDENDHLRLGEEARPVTLDELKGDLQKQTAADPDLKLTLSADKKASWGEIVKVMDAVKEANVKQGNINAFVRQTVQP